MKKSYEVLKQAFKNTPVKALAREMKLSPVLMYKWCQDPSQETQIVPRGAVNPLERVAQIFEKTQSLEVVSWLCQKANGFFVPNALIDQEAPDARLFKNTQKLIKEFSETLEKISDAFNNDGKISHKEAASIRKEWEDLKRIGEGFVFACEIGKFNKTTRTHKEEK